MQINVCVNNDPKEKYYATKEQALDPEFSLRYAAQAIANGDEHRWTVCNCRSYASLFVTLPNGPLIPNASPAIGHLAIFDYDGTPHVAVITEVGEEGFEVKEANYRPCKTGERVVRWDDPSLVGFRAPTSP